MKRLREWAADALFVAVAGALLVWALHTAATSTWSGWQ